MVDIHSHILWGVDDGPRTLEDSLTMLQAAAAAGTTDIVATPHANSRFQFDPVIIAARIAELRKTNHVIPRIHTGCDFHLSSLNIEDALENPSKYTINSGRYLMIELPEMFSENSIARILQRFSGKGIIPVITHPERNPVLQRSPTSLAGWVENGCLSQVTAQSVTGRFGPQAKQAAWRFIRSGWVHFVASDAHDIADRHPRLDSAAGLLQKEIGESTALRLLVDNPRAVIEDSDEPIDAPSLVHPKWYRFWQR